MSGPIEVGQTWQRLDGGGQVRVTSVDADGVLFRGPGGSGASSVAGFLRWYQHKPTIPLRIRGYEGGGGDVTVLHRWTVVAYVCMAVSCAWSAYLPTGTWFHAACAVLWMGLTGLAWHNGRNDARIKQAAHLSSMADGMSSVAHAVRGVSARLGPVAEDVAVAAFGAAAEMRADAIAVLEGKDT